jgi:glycosyltransferase involved in cell wall biosynthesis
MPTRIWYVADARLPAKAANTVQIVKMSAAFGSCGTDTTLWARALETDDPRALGEYYGAPATFRASRMPRWLPGQSRRDRWSVPFSLSALLHARRRRADFDLLYTRVPLLTLLAARSGLPVALEAHRLLPEDGPVSRWLEHALRRQSVGPAFRGLIAISAVLGAWYQDRGFAPGKCLVAHDGVDLERFDPPQDRARARAHVGWPDDRPIVGYCGHLYRGRGTEELLACAARLPHLRFMFVGGVDPELGAYRQAAERSRLDNVRFTGFVPNSQLAPYLFAADVLAMPYTRQTASAQYMSPMKMFEYMAAGRPIVASRFPSVGEVLQDRVNAILVEPEDVKELAAALDDATGAGAGAAALLGQRARRDVQACTWVRRAERILAFLGTRA